MRKDSDDFVVIPDSKSKNSTNRIIDVNQMAYDSDKDRDIKEFQEEVGRLKLENYHLREEIDQLAHRLNQPSNSRVKDLEVENEQLKIAIKRGNSQSGNSEINERYHKALKQISKLLKSNNQLRAQLEYVKDSSRKQQDSGMIEEIKRYQQQIKFLQETNQELKYRVNEGSGNGKDYIDDEMFKIQNRLKEREMDIQELQNLVEQSQRKYIATNNNFQKLVQDAENRYEQMQHQYKRREIEFRQQIQDYQNKLRSNEMELQTIKTEAGFFHNEMKQLRAQLQQLQSINQELRRQVNREESLVSESSTVGDLKVHINNLNNEIDELRHFNMNKDSSELMAENQVLERQILNLNNRNSTLQKQLAETRINLKQYTRKFESTKTKYQTLTQTYSQLENTSLKKQQRLTKIERENQLLKQKILNPGVRKAIADVEVAQDIDIGELKIKVRNCILTLQLVLNDPSEPHSPKQIEIEQLHNLKTLLIEIDMKVKTLIEDNDSMKKVILQNKGIIEELEDINGRLNNQSQNYELLINKLQLQFEKSISRNQKIEINMEKELNQHLQNIKQQNSIEIRCLRQQMETKILDYEVKLTTAKSNYKKSEMNLHNAYQQKQEEITTRLRQLDKAHNEAIRQLRILGPQKQETIARLYSSIHDLELELKLYKNQNDIADRNINELIQDIKLKNESNQVLQNNIKVILGSQSQKIQELQDYKLKERDQMIRSEGLDVQVRQLTEKIKALQTLNMSLQSQLRITQQEAAEFYHRNQTMMSQLNSRSHQFKISKDQDFNEVNILKKRIQIVAIQKQQLQQLRIKHQKHHLNEMTLNKKNYQQKMGLLQRNYQEGVKTIRTLQEKVDDLTLLNIQLYNQLRRYDDQISEVGKRSTEFGDRVLHRREYGSQGQRSHIVSSQNFATLKMNNQE